MTHSWFPSNSIIQDYVDYAYKIGWLDFLILIECENWRWTPDRKWDWGWSLWFCQLHWAWHKERYENDFTTNREKQLDICLAKYKGWTVFYWPDRILKETKKECKYSVGNKFILK